MELVIVSKNKKSEIYINNKKIKYNKEYCYIFGQIYNLDELDIFDKKITNEEKLLSLYKKYKEKLFHMLDGDYSFVISMDNKIILSRDRMGSKQWYYTKMNEEFIFSNSLKNIIDKYKNNLKIDKQVLSNYLCYSYINEPYTIFENVYKLNTASFLLYDSEINVYKYYDVVNEYIINKNQLKNYTDAFSILENVLITSIGKRIKNKDKIGVYFSSGVDSTLIAAIVKKVFNKTIDTYTIGFNEEDRNEAPRAKSIAEYIGTNHHEFYLDENTAKDIVNELFDIYSEPFSDPSMIPILFLNKNTDSNLDIILTGDGADQLFLGSTVYDYIASLKNRIRSIIKRKDIFLRFKLDVLKFINIEPKSYNDVKIISKKQIKYMLFDIKTFLANRLFTKMSVPAIYYNFNLAHPFIDNDCVEVAFKIKNKFKYYKKNKKYILKQILYKYIPKEKFNETKSGFGIPLKKWLSTIYYDDIVKYSNKRILDKQDLFESSKVSNIIGKLKENKITNNECYVLFSFYMFQLWYKKYIEDLWN